MQSTQRRFVPRSFDRRRMTYWRGESDSLPPWGEASLEFRASSETEAEKCRRAQWTFLCSSQPDGSRGTLPRFKTGLDPHSKFTFGNEQTSVKRATQSSAFSRSRRHSSHPRPSPRGGPGPDPAGVPHDPRWPRRGCCASIVQRPPPACRTLRAEAQRALGWTRRIGPGPSTR